MSKEAVKFKASAVTLKSTHRIKFFCSLSEEEASSSELAKEEKQAIPIVKKTNNRQKGMIFRILIALISNLNTPFKHDFSNNICKKE